MKNRPVELPTILRPLADSMHNVLLESLGHLTQPAPAVKIPAWPTFSKLTGGFRKHEFSIFCGPTGAGKTTFLANLSSELLKQNTRHFVMSVETGHHDFMIRVLSCLAGEDLNTGEAVPAERLEVIAADNANHLVNNCIEFSLYDNRLKVEQLIADVETMVFEKGVEVVFVDNLNFLLDVTRSSDSLVEMDRVIHELIMFVKKCPVHIVMVMHPKKTEGGRVVSEFDIKGSSTSVQEAQNVFLLNRMAPGPDYDPSVRELTLQKMRRRGAFSGSTIRFESVGTRYIERGLSRR